MRCADIDAFPDASSPTTGGEGAEADLFLFEIAAAMPPPNSAPVVNTAAWTIMALGICLKKSAREKKSSNFKGNGVVSSERATYQRR